MGHIQISRFRHHPVHGIPGTFERIQAMADATAQVEGVVSCRALLSHDQVILFSEFENWATLDRIADHPEVKKVRRHVFGQEHVPHCVGTEQWSSNHPKAHLE